MIAIVIKYLKSDRKWWNIKKVKWDIQTLLKKYILIDKYKDNRDFILKNNDDIIILKEDKLNDNFTLSETLLNFF